MSRHGFNPSLGRRGDYSDDDEDSADRVATFLEEHTDFLSHADTSNPPNTECPICLEGVEEHICVKITNLAGCQHLIGMKCLEEMLKRDPDKKKECPLCRAEWIKEDGIWQDSEEWAALANNGVGGSRVPHGQRGGSRDHGRGSARRDGGELDQLFAEVEANLSRLGGPDGGRGRSQRPSRPQSSRGPPGSSHRTSSRRPSFGEASWQPNGFSFSQNQAPRGGRGSGGGGGAALEQRFAEVEANLQRLHAGSSQRPSRRHESSRRPSPEGPSRQPSFGGSRQPRSSREPTRETGQHLPHIPINAPRRPARGPREDTQSWEPSNRPLGGGSGRQSGGGRTRRLPDGW